MKITGIKDWLLTETPVIREGTDKLNLQKTVLWLTTCWLLGVMLYSVLHFATLQDEFAAILLVLLATSFVSIHVMLYSRDVTAKEFPGNPELTAKWQARHGKKEE